MINIKKISVIGCGRLGLGLATAFASRGMNILGVDINKRIVDCINQEKAPWYEPNLSELMKRYSKNLRGTSNYREALEQTDVSIILVSTPSDTYGKFSNRYVEKALESLARLLKNNIKPYHLIILSCTVMPGSIQNRLISLVERKSGRKYGKGFGFSYVPDFVALGTLINDFLFPDFVMIGTEDQKSGDITETIFRVLVGKKVPIRRLTFSEAELAKVALNCFITTKISFANSLANLAEKIPNVNVDNITNTIKLDKRIAPYYFTGGPSFGGNCFPRDTKAYIALAKKHGVQSDLISAVDAVNKKQNLYIAKLAIEYAKKDGRDILILGSSFKPDTSVIEESLAWNIVPMLLRHNLSVSLFDERALEEIKKKFGNKVHVVFKKKDFFSEPRVIILPISSPYFKKLNYETVKRGSTIIDCWRIVNQKLLPVGVDYIGLGISRG